VWRRRAEVGDDGLAELATDAPEPEQLSHEIALRRTLDRVLARLPIELRALLVLHELEQMTMAEIAGTLGLRPGTVASRLRRARGEFEALAARAFPKGGE